VGGRRDLKGSREKSRSACRRWSMWRFGVTERPAALRRSGTGDAGPAPSGSASGSDAPSGSHRSEIRAVSDRIVLTCDPAPPALGSQRREDARGWCLKVTYLILRRSVGGCAGEGGGSLHARSAVAVAGASPPIGNGWDSMEIAGPRRLGGGNAIGQPTRWCIGWMRRGRWGGVEGQGGGTRSPGAEAPRPATAARWSPGASRASASAR